MGASFTLNPAWPHVLGIGITLLSIFAGVTRIVLYDWSDFSHCNALLTRGTWLDSDRRNWQPDGCMIYHYKPAEASQCLQSRPVVFIGDSVIRTLFFQFAHIVDPKLPTSPPDVTQKHSDHVLPAPSGSEMSFFWDPFLNTSRTLAILQTSKNDTLASQRPALLVLGSGLWYLRYANTSGGLPSWEGNMERIFGILARGQDKPADQIVILPVEQVIPSKLSEDRALSIRPSDIAAMNSDLSHRIRLHSSGISGMSQDSVIFPGIAFPIVFNKMLDSSQTEDGLHFSRSLVTLQANILFNLRCNDVLPKKSPLDKTCCNTYPRPALLHCVVLGIMVGWGPILYIFSSRLGRFHKTTLSRLTDISIFYVGRHSPPWISETKFPALVFSASIALLFLADRTGFWLKEQKQFDPWTFSFLCLACLGIGLLTLKKSDKDLGFLNREQTDEWKGWMQVVILIYHYCGASKISGIYNTIRVFVASYLFMTGYGHTFFYLKKADFGFLRVAQILVRLNLLTVCLAYAMDTDYLSYYFSPLVSMWYVTVYSTMACFPSLNNRASFICKIITSASLVTLFMRHSSLLQNLFDCLHRVANIRWSAREWAFRVNLDLWIVYAGMLTAVLVSKAREHRITEHVRWPLIIKVGLGASMAGLIWFFAFQLSEESKYTYNQWHPFISFIPVLTFVLLRNSTAVMRATSSSAFTFIGRCSLETFIIQYHFWLAADTRGILLVLPSIHWRPLNFTLTTIMFVFISDQMARSTEKLTSWICGNAKKTVPAASVLCQTSLMLSSETSIPLTAANSTMAINHDQSSSLVRPQLRWVDRLANGFQPTMTVWPANKAWINKLHPRLFAWIGVIWMLNLLWVK